MFWYRLELNIACPWQFQRIWECSVPEVTPCVLSSNYARDRDVSDFHSRRLNDFLVETITRWAPSYCQNETHSTQKMVDHWVSRVSISFGLGSFTTCDTRRRPHDGASFLVGLHPSVWWQAAQRGWRGIMSRQCNHHSFLTLRICSPQCLIYREVWTG